MPADFRLDDPNSNSYARFPVQVRNIVSFYVTADGTAPSATKEIANVETTVIGARISKILVTNSSSDNVILFYLHAGNDGPPVGALPAFFCAIQADVGMGTDITKPAISVLRSINLDPVVDLDNNGNPYIMISPGWALSAGMISAVDAAAAVQVSVWIDEY